MFKTTVLSALCLLFIIATTPPIQKYEVGDVVKDFTLENIDGKKVSLSSYNNEKGVILIFDCNTCPYSQTSTFQIPISGLSCNGDKPQRSKPVARRFYGKNDFIC